MTYIERQRLLDKARHEKIINEWQAYRAWARWALSVITGRILEAK